MYFRFSTTQRRVVLCQIEGEKLSEMGKKSNESIPINTSSRGGVDHDGQHDATPPVSTRMSSVSSHHSVFKA